MTERANPCDMEVWWPDPYRRAWNAMDPRWRARARVLLRRLDERFGGMVVGQTRLLGDLSEHAGIPYTTGRRTLELLVGAGILRRRLADGRKVVWVPELLVDASVAPHVEDLHA